MTQLPPSDATEKEVAAWVRAAVASMDDAPTKRNWRYSALGMTVGQAIAQAPEVSRLGFRVPTPEFRIVRQVAKERNVGTEALARRAFGTWLVAVAGVDPEAIPYLTRGGILGP